MNYMERLQKVIANAGICSRRKAEELITNGQVKVNESQHTIQIGTTIYDLYVNGEELHYLFLAPFVLFGDAVIAHIGVGGNKFVVRLATEKIFNIS